MATMKIKNQKDIGLYIEALLNEKNWSQSDLAKTLSKMEGLNVSRDLVSKWVRGERCPGIDHIYYLAQAFNVSIENILMAGSQRENFDDRPFSLYAVAKSGDIERLEQLLNKDNEGRCIAENYDEFDKTILDYLIEFNQVGLIKYMFKEGYLSVWSTQTNTAVRLGNLTQTEDKFNQFIELAIEKDDVELYNYLISRTRPILQKEEECVFDVFQANQYRRDGYVFGQIMLDRLLEAKNILNSYMCSFSLTESEWKEWNSGILYFKNNRSRELCSELEKVPSICASFNLIMNYLLLKKREEGEKLLDFAIQQRKLTEDYLQEVKYMESPYSYKINKEGRVVADSYGYGCLACVGVVFPSVYEKLSTSLKSKAKLLYQG